MNDAPLIFRPGTRFVTSGVRVHMSGIRIATTNLVINPSFEVDLTDWLAGAGLQSFTRVDTYAAFGAWSARMYEASCAVTNEYINTGYMAISASTVYTASAYVKKTICTGTGQFIIWWHDAAFASLGSASLTFTSGTHDWKRYTRSATSPVGAAYARAIVAFTGLTVGTEAEVFVDAVQFEQQPAATAYCDGSLGPGCYWNGVPHASTSYRLGI